MTVLSWTLFNIWTMSPFVTREWSHYSNVHQKGSDSANFKYNLPQNPSLQCEKYLLRPIQA